MQSVIVHSDVDGTLVRISDGAGSHYAKLLSTEIAWHTFEPRELENVGEAAVAKVDTDLERRFHKVSYRPDVEPLQFLTLRDLIQREGPLTMWRTATLMAQLARRLEALHAADIQQLVLHPGRIGQTGDGLVLLSTLACVLPPLPTAFANMSEGWLHYIAPEVLRTRAMQKELLAAGDVYAFGRLMEAASVSSAEEAGDKDAFALAQRRVEAMDPARFGTLPPSLAGIGALITEMCLHIPATRPTLPSVVARLAAICSETAPEIAFEAARQRGSLAEARAIHADLAESCNERLFGVDPRRQLLMRADLALLEQPPQCAEAVQALEQAESKERYELDVQHRLARAYALWTSHPQSIAASSRAYRLAAGLSAWRASIVDEWTAVLGRAGDATQLIAATDEVPADLRSVRLVEARARALDSLGDRFSAWEEIAAVFPRVSFDQALFDCALDIARRIEPTLLISWMHRQSGDPGFAGPLAIVWQLNGNMEMANTYREQASVYRR